MAFQSSTNLALEYESVGSAVAAEQLFLPF